MALVKCKNCGNDVSDSAQKCPHCGCDLKTETLKKVKADNFSDLPLQDQEKLINEFYDTYPSYKNVDAKIDKCLQIKKITDVISWIGLGLIILFAIIIFLQEDINVVIAGLLIASIVIQVGGDIGEIIVSVFIMKYRRKSASTEKQIQRFLMQEKNIAYHPKAN